MKHSDLSWSKMCEEWGHLAPPTHKRQLLLDESMLEIPSDESPFSKSSITAGTSPFLSTSTSSSSTSAPSTVSTSTQIGSPTTDRGEGPTGSIYSFLVGAVSGSEVAEDSTSAVRSPLASIVPAADPQPGEEVSEEDVAANNERKLREYF